MFSGMQPTGDVHLGNYLGALRWWVSDQHQADSFYCVVDLHALTIPGDPAALREATSRTAALLLAIGLDPDVCTIFVQSHVPAHSQLTWLLECTASMGELQRMTQFKDKAARDGEVSARVGLFAYPVLMAADILLYDTDRVPVGDDQRQHLELTRDLAQRWNARYGETFVVPEAAIPPPGRGARVMDLQTPTAKMSKSAESPQGTIGLLDDPADIERKVRRAVTDADTGTDAVRWDRDAKPGVSNLLEILGTLTGRTPEDVAAGYDRYGPLKADTAEAIIERVRPIQARYKELTEDPQHVSNAMRAGAQRANEVASATVARASEAIGLLPPLVPQAARTS
ncbi:MAG: tryptophan--tRNA ligase [Acidimicrobiaceae bacterium]|nr:tryptophan--tRNA ligase [Acidimicrobiaceae bacterium]